MPTTTPFNNLITFSRGSNATVTGSNGLIQWAPNNLLTFSEQFDSATWQKFGGGAATAPAVTANAGVAPDGTTTADRIQFALNGGTTSTDRSLLSQSATLATSFPYTYSIWVRSLTGTLSMGIGCDNLVGNTPITVTTEWQRFTVSGTATGTAGVALLQLRGGQTPVQSNAADVLVWGAQLEIGSTATTYNPTTVKNLLGFSEAFDNAAWVKTRAFIVTGAAANPVNGLFNAQKLMEDTTATNSHLVAIGGGAVGSSETLSVYVRNAGRQWIALQIGSSASAYFDLNAGVLGTATGGTASIVNIGGGWYRCSLSAVRAGTTNNFIYLASANNTTSYTGDGNSGVYIYGAQLSDSASLDPYVPTPGAAPSSTAFYGPRFDFDPVTLQPRGLLVEEQRTNLTQYSQDFTNAWWTKTNLNVATGAGIAPDGTNTANSATPTAISGTHYVTRNIASAATNTVSWYVKPTGSYTKVAWFEEINTGVYATFDLSGAGSIITTSGATATITAVGNGWYRITGTAASPGGTGFSLWFIPQTYTSGSPTGPWTPNGTDGFLVWAAQFEAGAFATSYIPTVASTVTRSADVATITGQNFAQWYAQANGSVIAEFSPIIVPTSGSRVFSINDGTSTNRILSSPSITSHLLVVTGGVSQADLDGGTPTANVTNKTAAAYALNDFAVSLNAGATVTDTTGTVPTVSSFNIGSENGSSQLNGHIRNIRFIPARAADFQLQGLST